MWYAGIDWANDHHDVVVIDESMFWKNAERTLLST